MVREIRAESKVADADLMTWPLTDGRVATSRAPGVGVTIGSKAIAAEAARRLMASFDKRLASWRDEASR